MHLEKLAVKFRAMQLIAHAGHNKVSGPTFFEDHEFLGGLYGTYEGIYDALVERLIGLGKSPDLGKVGDEANTYFQEEIKDLCPGSSAFLTCLLECEKEANDLVEKATSSKEYTQATINLLAQIGDDSEVRQYKIQQRLGDMGLNEKPGDALDRLMHEKMQEEDEGEEKEE
jgi:DNA-binding ferritin-like protein